MRSTHLLLTLATLSCPACAVEYDDDDFRSAPDSGGNSGGGTVFNTNELDDVRFSELTPKGKVVPNSMYQPGFTLEEMTLLKGPPLPGFKVESGEIIGVDELAGTYKGEDLLESDWKISHGGATYSMRLIHAEKYSDDVERYYFVRVNDFGLEISTCPSGPNGTGVARVLAGFSLNEGSGDITDAPDTTYFACDTGATGKAADLGFYDLSVEQNAPGSLDTKSELEPWLPLELAIRVLRADYCYDGHSYTKPGTAVWIEDLWDVVGPDPDKLGNPVEAVWGADKLLCAGGTGRHGAPITCEGQAPIPPCNPNVALNKYPDGLFLTRL